MAKITFLGIKNLIVKSLAEALEKDKLVYDSDCDDEGYKYIKDSEDFLQKVKTAKNIEELERVWETPERDGGVPISIIQFILNWSK
jgi:hypothetical protein